MARVAVVTMLLLLSACGGQPPKAGEDKGNTAAPATPATDAPAEANVAAVEDVPMNDWLVGTWSFEDSCATDFVVSYEADGRLDNSGEIGRWTIDGGTVTETITERQEAGGEDPVKIDPPETRRYTVSRSDADHGLVRFQSRTVRIQRC